MDPNVLNSVQNDLTATRNATHLDDKLDQVLTQALMSNYNIAIALWQSLTEKVDHNRDPIIQKIG